MSGSRVSSGAKATGHGGNGASGILEGSRRPATLPAPSVSASRLRSAAPGRPPMLRRRSSVPSANGGLHPATVEYQSPPASQVPQSRAADRRPASGGNLHECDSSSSLSRQPMGRLSHSFPLDVPNGLHRARRMQSCPSLPDSAPLILPRPDQGRLPDLPVRGSMAGHGGI